MPEYTFRPFASILNRKRKLEHSTEAQQFGLLESFENPRPERDYQIIHTCHEFTSVCPKTGQPDFGVITVEYIPDRLCLELRALKYYLQSYRQQGIYYEAVINKITDHLVEACRPRHLKVTGDFSIRGGLSSVVSAEYDISGTA